MKRSIRADSDSCWNWNARRHVSGSRVEFLHLASVSGLNFEIRRKEGVFGTLQKSMLLTPLLPRAGPTGGLGLAWPAPTMSFTIWSVAITFLAIILAAVVDPLHQSVALGVL